MLSKTTVGHFVIWSCQYCPGEIFVELQVRLATYERQMNMRMLSSMGLTSQSVWVQVSSRSASSLWLFSIFAAGHTSFYNSLCFMNLSSAVSSRCIAMQSTWAISNCYTLPYHQRCKSQQCVMSSINCLLNGKQNNEIM